MAQNEANAPTDFEAPAPVCVCGLLVVAALTKVGHPHWAIGGMISVYALYLAMQYAKHSAGDNLNVRTSTVGLTTAATIAVATVVTSAAVVARSPLAYFSKAENRSSPSSANSPGQPLIRNVTNPDRTLPA
jgi:hypothetical protein